MKNLFFTMAFVSFGVFSFAGNEIEPKLDSSLDKVLDCHTYVYTHSFKKADGTVVTSCTTYTECDTDKELDDYEASGDNPCLN